MSLSIAISPECLKILSTFGDTRSKIEENNHARSIATNIGQTDGSEWENSIIIASRAGLATIGIAIGTNNGSSPFTSGNNVSSGEKRIFTAVKNKIIPDPKYSVVWDTWKKVDICSPKKENPSIINNAINISLMMM